MDSDQCHKSQIALNRTPVCLYNGLPISWLYLTICLVITNPHNDDWTRATRSILLQLDSTTDCDGHCPPTINLFSVVLKFDDHEPSASADLLLHFSVGCFGFKNIGHWKVQSRSEVIKIPNISPLDNIISLRGLKVIQNIFPELHANGKQYSNDINLPKSGLIYWNNTQNISVLIAFLEWFYISNSFTRMVNKIPIILQFYKFYI